jgi:thioredoxin reductase
VSFGDLTSDRLTFSDLEELENALYEKGCTDGLPIIPPTPERVQAMIEYNKLDPQLVVAIKVPPQNGVATVEKIAINAVMAGCRPEYLPVVIAAVEAMTAPGFDLFGVQATTHPCAMIVFINGPIRKQLNINCGSGAMGPGWQANATIGRAVRLIMLNLGGAHPGAVDKSTQGTPAKYTFCFGENEEESPWEPFHVSRGFKPDDSTVTVLGLEGPQDINGQDATKPESFLRILTSSLLSPGTSNFRFTTGSDLMICLGPEHAAILGRGNVTREQVKEHLFEHARVPLNLVSEEHMVRRKQVPAQHGEFDGVSPIPVVKSKDNFLIAVVGGSGLHSSWMPSWGGPKHQAVTKLIRPTASKVQAEKYDVLVIGQGYAGLCASKLAAARGFRTANFESECMGGLIINLNHLDPAPSEGEQAGFELASAFAMENLENGVAPVSDEVMSVEHDGDAWIVKTAKETYAAPQVIIASGARLRKLGVPGEAEFFGRGVSECADCDGPMFKDRETIVVGGGDSAFQEALALSEFASKVTIVMRGDIPRARPDLVALVADNPKIVQVTKSQVKEIRGGESGVDSVILKPKNGSAQEVACAGVFVFIGLEPSTGFLPATLKRDKTGAIVASADGRTDAPGLWAIGAVRSGFSGLLTDAAMEAERVVALLPAKTH